ncbi:hypothetical protein EDEG_00449 [Edhazardia aedis USNM 41457]|uniref:AMP-dependent synthetase/ligase domain-containing protein n=1 Tax=Edhazardia aedis (strain USNM 41457) TaxID=1003232 RepID=J9DJA1_EDHAE|nr:hypothetical protein EDEG_00449 [Edhazardia aedis USNM 41457]|eukprot:EJW01457.1 hypothetical protein EDEG_00449 [Edhazardia aedis USNM 41457]
MIDQMIEENGVYRHPEYNADIVSLKDGSETLLEMFFNVVKRSYDNDFLGTLNERSDKVVYESYGSIFRKSLVFGEYVLNLKNKMAENANFSETSAKNRNTKVNRSVDVSSNYSSNSSMPYVLDSPNDEDKELIGIFSVNRAEWIISEYAIYYSDSTNCPLYSSFGIESLKHILTETSMRICFISGVKAESLYNDVISKFETSLEHLICYDELSDELVSNLCEKGVKVHYFDDILGEYDRTWSERCESEDDKSNESSNSISTSDDSNSMRITNRIEGSQEKGYLNSSRDSGKNVNSSCDSGKNLQSKHENDLNKNTKRVKMPLNVLQAPKKELFECFNSAFLKGTDIATICYTSGTSGLPKGVILSHKNFIVTAAGFLRCRGTSDQFKISSEDVYISYLPLAHVMERVCVVVTTCNGAKIGFFRGNPKCLQQDIKTIKPTFFVGVPRVFNVFEKKSKKKLPKRVFLPISSSTCV